MKNDHTYLIKSVPFKDSTPIWIDRRGIQRTDVFTPMAYIHYKIEERMKKLDQLMVKYIDNYLRKRSELADEFNNIHGGVSILSHVELMSSFSPEERKEFNQLKKESDKRIYSKI